MDIKDWRHVVDEKSALIQSLNESVVSSKEINSSLKQQVHELNE